MILYLAVADAARSQTDSKSRAIVPAENKFSWIFLKARFPLLAFPCGRAKWNCVTGLTMPARRRAICDLDHTSASHAQPPVNCCRLPAKGRSPRLAARALRE